MADYKKKTQKLTRITLLASLLVVLMIGLGTLFSHEEVDKASAVVPTTTKSQNSQGPHQLVTKDGYQITVNQVERYRGSALDKPQAGHEFVICNVTIKNNSKVDQHYTNLDFKFCDGNDDCQVGRTLMDKNYVHDSLQFGTLAPQEMVTGNLVGEVRRGSGDLSLHFKPADIGTKVEKINLG
ncbi:hypothetical protein PL11_006195 [Lentilactobacillus curieae]|uniref:DUF4352 domain-containing protein n=1 Tax=Lentilactobacillus curieae TaxID=1138822 RepID=A0A1S6QIW9_9LACO|nr:DUF4352 domain-containing protein [Lentilactobacillus curieae]AQW21551.1 hypothetical protein PL11_006195 [Lentilactobacillus curieae]